MSLREIYTIGTSNRYIEDFIEILKIHKIKIAIDVRSFPTSKKFVHFSQSYLCKALQKEGIKYVYLGRQLGGFRKEGYKIHMNTEEFKKGIKTLEKFAKKERTLFFCCEKLFFRCHRRFISEELTKKGWKVLHIIDKDKIYEHQYRCTNQEQLNFCS